MNKAKYFFLGLLGLFLLSADNSQAQDKQDKWTLKECISYAYENNLRLQSSKLNMEQSQANLMEAKGARLPNLSFSSSYRLNFGRSIDPTTNTFINEQITSVGINASSDVTLFNGFRLLNQVKQNQAQLKESEYNFRDIKNQVALDVITFFLNIQFNQEVVENAQAQLSSTKEQLAQVEKMVKAGARPITDELNLEAQLASNELELIQAENQLRLAKLSLKQHLQIPAQEGFQVTIEEVNVDSLALQSVSIDQVYDNALQSQPQVKRAEAGLQSADLGLEIARSAYYPRLSLSADAFSNYSSARSRDPQDLMSDYLLFDQLDDNLSQAVGLQLSYPIFSQFSREAGVQRAIVQKKQAKVNTKQVRNELRQVIESAYYDVEAASKAYYAAKKQVNASEASYESTQRSYQLGASNFVDYQVAANRLQQAQNALSQNKYDFVFKLKVLDFYQGKTIEF